MFDRQVLGDELNCTIKSLEIYYSDRGIASVKARYRLESGGEKETQMAIPQAFASNYCKTHLISTTNGDFIRYFKVRFSPQEGRITHIKIVSNRGMKGGWGDSKIKDTPEDETQKEMVFDISEDEYAVSIFCSHVQRGPYWYLCGFGVEVNDL